MPRACFGDSEHGSSKRKSALPRVSYRLLYFRSLLGYCYALIHALHAQAARGGARRRETGTSVAAAVGVVLLNDEEG